jgi:hypothetical protein
MRKILLRGTIANKPNSGGQRLIPLQYVLGLRRLGFDVLLFEDLKAENCWMTTKTGAALSNRFSTSIS